MRFSLQALLTRRDASLLPSGLRVMGALLQLGAAPSDEGVSFEEAAAARVWNAAAAAATAGFGNYFEVVLEEEDFVVLSQPIEFWSAVCSKLHQLILPFFSILPEAAL